MSDDLETRRLAREAAWPDAQPRRATQEELAKASTKHSTESGSVQPPLAEPLSRAELAHPRGGGWAPAITSVDCTPRPRYGESTEKFAARMRGYGMVDAELRKAISGLNRRAALRVVLDDGRVSKWADVEHEVEAGNLVAVAYFTRCACGWCGLRGADPELARREYDAHACAAMSIGDDAVSRAQAHAGKATMPPKRRTSVLQPAIAEQSSPDMGHLAHYDLGARPGDLTRRREEEDDASQRFALLDLERK